MSCFITHTSENVHEILSAGFEKSPMFNGRIKGIGPRYCPSIEDKIIRFSQKKKHQLFIEPEGRNTIEMYLNGFSTSLPQEIQLKALRNIAGFEKVKLFRSGYAIEYDYFPPTQLNNTLETKIIKNLFFCGQINGTTGYEEAGCQGLIAGINAHQNICNKPPFILNRSDAYIGVLIDDLITKGTEEPYRMFTSRAEYRLLLRQDNADIRLTRKGFELGLVDKKRLGALEKKINQTNSLISFLNSQSVSPKTINPILSKKNSAKILQKKKLSLILSRPHINLNDLNVSNELSDFLSDKKIQKDALTQAEINIKYKGYFTKEKESVKKLKKLEAIKINDDFEYEKLHSMSAEGKEKLKKVRPKNMGQASRISGVSASDINILLIYITK